MKQKAACNALSVGILARRLSNAAMITPSYFVIALLAKTRRRNNQRPFRITGHNGLGGEPPGPLVEPLRAHLAGVAEQHRQDVAAGVGVSLPGALHKKYPSAPSSWGWYYLFPARKVCTDPRWAPDRPLRHHLHETALQRAVKGAIRAAAKLSPPRPTPPMKQLPDLTPPDVARARLRFLRSWTGNLEQALRGIYMEEGSMSGEFRTKDGGRVAKAEDGEFEVGANPFGICCAECGVVQSVRFRVEGERLFLEVSHDDVETQRLREHLGVEPLLEKFTKAQQLLANWQATGQAVQAVLLEVGEIMESAINAVQLGDCSGAILACKAVEELVAPFVPEVKKEERRLVIC